VHGSAVQAPGGYANATPRHDPDGLLIGVWALDLGDGEVRGVASIANPDKLRHVAEVGSMKDALMRLRPSASS
jgi:hypothetical protein